MSVRARICAAISLPLVLAACGTADGGTQAAATSATASMSGMSMSGGSMSGGSMSHGSMSHGSSHGAPPKNAAMVCGDEIRGEIGQVLGIPSLSATPTWADSVYTCRYDLPAGRLVLSVNVAPDKVAAGTYFDHRRQATAGATALAGLGERSFGTPGGTVAVVKDDMTLTVDATALPAVFGANQQKRADFAYEVASVVLGCWTGDE